MQTLRITPTGAFVPVRKPVDPASMTDKELKEKICTNSVKHCMSCGVYDNCNFGKEAVRRFGEVK